MHRIPWQQLCNINPLQSLSALVQKVTTSTEMPPALSDEEASEVEVPPFPPLSSRNSASVAEDDGDADDAGFVDEPVATEKNVAGSNGSEDEDNDDEDMEEDEFIVEAIKNHMIDEDGTLKFQVKWEGYDSKKDLTWEPEENLDIGGREKIFEQTEKAARGKKRGRGASNAASNSTKRARKNGTHPSNSTPPASASQEWAPPAGSWEDEIATIDACQGQGSGRLTVFLIWKNGKKTRHDTSIIYKKCPQKLEWREEMRSFLVLGGLGKTVFDYKIRSRKRKIIQRDKKQVQNPGNQRQTTNINLQSTNNNMVQRNHTVAIIIIVLFLLLVGISFGIWKFVNAVRPDLSVTSAESSSSGSVVD
ncbi:hypothetical protein E4U43_000818 [Claviceps pusilla]|uniref:Chromo domain-containing protein n=1 Tax=Claviceps pusilla TaxID=123648 RepID=A0A9P7N9D5_9HYPO|nr:hypothetical protein E4U43_000818 [Claviceps pusilla]